MRSFDLIGSLAIVTLVVTMSACAPESEDPGADDGQQTSKHEDQAGITNPAGDVGPLEAVCGSSPFNDDQGVPFPHAAFFGAAKQRSGSSTSCLALGVLQPSDTALYFCWTAGLDGFSWTYLQNARTGVRGWIRGDLLISGGSDVRCVF